MKKMKRILALVLSVLMIGAVFALPASAATKRYDVTVNLVVHQKAGAINNYTGINDATICGGTAVSLYQNGKAKYTKVTGLNLIDAFDGYSGILSVKFSNVTPGTYRVYIDRQKAELKLFSLSWEMVDSRVDVTVNGNTSVDVHMNKLDFENSKETKITNRTDMNIDSFYFPWESVVIRSEPKKGYTFKGYYETAEGFNGVPGTAPASDVIKNINTFGGSCVTGNTLIVVKMDQPHSIYCYSAK